MEIAISLDLTKLIDPMHRCIAYLDQDKVRGAIKAERRRTDAHEAITLAELTKLEDLLDFAAAASDIKG